MDESCNVQYKKCYVAFIDILGFKDYVQNNSCDAVHTVLSYLEVEAVANPYSIKSKFGIDTKDIKILCISDSIIVSIEESIPHALEAIIWLCAAFQLTLLLNARLLMRGGISCGDFYTENSVRTGNPILFGQAYNNAVELEKSKKYGGKPVIIVDENMNHSNLKSCPFLAEESKYGLLFVDYMHNAKTVGAFDMKMRFVAKEIVDRIKIFENDTRKKEKYEWTKNYIINSLNDELVFSDDNIFLCKRHYQPLNIKLEFAKQEAQNG